MIATASWLSLSIKYLFSNNSYLKFVPTVFYQSFNFLLNDTPSKAVKNVF